MGLRAPALISSLDQCARAPSSGTTPTQITNPIDMFIDWSLYMAHRCLFLLGAPDLWIRLGWLHSSTRNGMKWGTLALLEISHSRGCYLKFAVLLVQKGVFTKTTKYQRPRALSPRGLYSWWHFMSPANGNGSCDCAPVTWAYGALCPAMVSPNAGLRRGQAIVPGSSPYMVHEKWIQARASTDNGYIFVVTRTDIWTLFTKSYAFIYMFQNGQLCATNQPGRAIVPTRDDPRDSAHRDLSCHH